MAKPFVKWVGGKEKELNIILENLPNQINNFYEPFVGGGAVFFAVKDLNITGERYINDKSVELITLYNNIANNNPIFFNYLNQLNHNWELLSEIVNNNGNADINTALRTKALASVRNHSTKLGGNFYGIIERLPQLANEGVARIVGTPFTKDTISSLG